MNALDLAAVKASLTRTLGLSAAAAPAVTALAATPAPSKDDDQPAAPRLIDTL